MGTFMIWTRLKNTSQQHGLWENLAGPSGICSLRLPTPPPAIPEPLFLRQGSGEGWWCAQWKHILEDSPPIPSAPLTSEEVTVPISQGGDEFTSQQPQRVWENDDEGPEFVKSTCVWNSLKIMTSERCGHPPTFLPPQRGDGGRP